MSETTGDRPRILIIDDEREILNIFDYLLQRVYRLVLVSDARQVFSILSNETFHLVITDLVMPRFSGRQILEFAGSMKPSPPIVVCSGFLTDETERQELLRMGARGFINKPFEPPQKILDLIARIFKEGK